MEEEFCNWCGSDYNPNYVDKPCPHCGRQYNNLDIEKETSMPKLEAFARGAVAINIPEQYIGVEWKKEILQREKPQLLNDAFFERYVRNLDKIKTVFATGVIPGKSALIIAPPEFSKVTWAYTCMQLSVKAGLKVAPMLDTIELKRLIVMSAEKPNYRLYNKIRYDDYISSDIVFITVTKTDFRFNAYSIIIEILDKRSRMGLPTYIISRYDDIELSKEDRYVEFRALFNKSPNSNGLKYPAVIMYKERM